VIPFPQPRPPNDARYKLQYERPTSINATGSYPLKFATRSSDRLAIDLVVTMPGAIFQDKDYLNHRYFYKRAHYLACLAEGIKNSKEHKFKISFDCLNGNHLQPILVVEPNGDGSADDFSSSNCVICILLAVNEKTFPENRLRPTANCIRSSGTDDDPGSKSMPPTPFYNATLQSDASITPYLKLLHATSSKSDAFRDACVLGRIWLKQREFTSGVRNGGFGNFEWAALMALLLQPNPGSGAQSLSSGYSSYQLFKATLQFLATHSLCRLPYKFQAPQAIFPMANTTPVFFDGPRNLNILFKMTAWSYARLQQEAKMSVETLRDPLFDHFDTTFIIKTETPAYRYDATIRIPLWAFGLDPLGDQYDQQLADNCRQLHDTLKSALTDRVTTLTLSLPGEPSWRVSSSKPSANLQRSLLVSIATDQTSANRKVDHGPPAENKMEAATFRQFWGDKAELRRFKDGSILESVVWSIQDQSPSVLEQIARFIIRKHMGVQVADEMRFAGDAFAHIISSGRIQGQSGTAPFASYMSALSALEKDIRDLESLPLSIRQISAADPQLRYSTAEPDSMRIPASVVLQFEGSARWPDDLCAIQRTKIAFLLKLSDLLSAEKSVYVAKVGLENPSQPSQNQAFLDIVAPGSYSFRIRIHHDREAYLLERQLKDKSLDGQSREIAATAFGSYKRDFLRVTAHTQTVQKLCTQYPALSPAIRLTKKWFASHLLSPHFHSELIEMFVVRTFLQHDPWPVPACATTGFLRTLLWISRWDWRHTPLIIDLSPTTGNATTTAEIEGGVSKNLTADDVVKIQTRFDAWRRIDPAMNRVSIFAATNLDSEGTTWTDKGKPGKVVAARMTALARAATSAVREYENALLSLLDGNERSTEVETFSPETLFVSDTQDYDILIHLASKYTTMSKKKTEPRFKNLEIQGATTSHKHQDIGFLPAELFVHELQDVYGDAILWFWNPDKYDVIAGLWNPVVVAQRPWKIKPGWNNSPVKSRDMELKEGEEGQSGVDIRLNKGAICNEIKRLAGELVSSIELIR
jgi:U3 small nucleolar RNA-associated protein 22